MPDSMALVDHLKQSGALDNLFAAPAQWLLRFSGHRSPLVQAC